MGDNVTKRLKAVCTMMAWTHDHVHMDYLSIRRARTRSALPDAKDGKKRDCQEIAVHVRARTERDETPLGNSRITFGFQL